MADTIIEEAIADAREKMARAVEHAKGEFGAIRTGRGGAGPRRELKVDYYGAEYLQSIAGTTVPEACTLVIHPYDKGAIKAIDKAIRFPTSACTRRTTGRSCGRSSRHSTRNAAVSS